MLQLTAHYIVGGGGRVQKNKKGVARTLDHLLCTICSWVTKILNKEPAQGPKTYDSYGNSLYATSNERMTEFPANYVLLKGKRKMCVLRLYAKNFR